MEVRSTIHSKYNIDYHLVWIPKYRHSILTGEVADHIKDILHTIAEEKGVEILELQIMPDHIRMFVSSPPQPIPAHQLVQRHKCEDVQLLVWESRSASQMD